VKLIDFANEGIRPVVDPTTCVDCRECLEVCPAIGTDFGTLPTGMSRDPIRFKGSSGGALTALAAYGLEVAGMHGVLHIGPDPYEPIRNRTQLSKTRHELITATGSRYSPASVCDHLEWVEQANGPCVIVSAVAKARKARPLLDKNVGLTLSFFCAETPSTAGTIALLSQMGISPESIVDLRYRGTGWPGFLNSSPIERAGGSSKRFAHGRCRCGPTAAGSWQTFPAVILGIRSRMGLIPVRH
jgi:coenzyme F420 hydrogenase subunit beta